MTNKEDALFAIKDFVCDRYESCSYGCPFNYRGITCTHYVTDPERYDLVKTIKESDDGVRIIKSLMKYVEYRDLWFSLIGTKVR